MRKVTSGSGNTTGRRRPSKGWGIRSLIGLFIASLVLGVGGSVTGQRRERQEVARRGVSSVRAVEIDRGDGSYRAASDSAPPAPNHPPIDQIPPMPMPDDTGLAEASSATGPGKGLVYDASTGEIHEWAADFSRVTEGFVSGGGYPGADGGGGDGDIDLPATFTNMSLINTASRAIHPWRMNVKLVMRFGTSFFVCSGTMRDAETVLTAGHCVFDFGGAGWANEIWVYPGWDGVGSVVPNPPTIAQPYGWARGTFFGSWTGWTQNGDFNYDVGLVGVTRAVGMLTGWFGWSFGGSCAFHTSNTYHNASYPAEGCGQPGLHNGRDMYYWFGTFDSCPSFNRLQIDTSGGCFNAGWGGMSGSGAYRIDGDNRFVHAVASTSNRSTFTRYARQFEDWVNFSNDSFIPQVRGAAFDLQALDMNASPSTIVAGNSTTLLNHLAANPTNGGANGTWTFRVYLSTNSNITTADTLLSTQFINWNFAPMSSVRVNMVQVTIPATTPPGNYFLGVIYDPATDGNDSNDSTQNWDAAPITVTARDLDITALSAPSSAEPGDTISVLNTVRNIGNATAGSFRVGIYLSTNNICSTGDSLLASRTVLSLGAGASSTQNTSVTIPPSTPLSTRFICAIADDLSQIPETSESNNSEFVAIDIVGDPDLMMTALDGPASASPGDMISVSNTVRNAGIAPAGSFRVGLYLSADAICTTTDTLLGFRALAGLAAGASSAANTSVTIPLGSTPGNQFICAIADYLAAVAESNEANNTASDPINIQPLVPTVNLKVNGMDADFPSLIPSTGPVQLTIDMTPGPDPLDHYFAIIFNDGSVRWATPGGLSITPAPLTNFTPTALTNFVLIDATLPAGFWGFAWFMLNGGTVVDSDIIGVNVSTTSTE